MVVPGGKVVVVVVLVGSDVVVLVGPGSNVISMDIYNASLC